MKSKRAIWLLPTHHHNQSKSRSSLVFSPDEVTQRYCKWGGACYKSFVGIRRKTFSDAMKICRKDGGTLAMPRDNDTTAFLISIVPRGFAYWIGLHDQREEGTFDAPKDRVVV
ncbi:hypothetical protein Bbelb_100130 [Branchiostoma belcheri]|nr:hypothetical protein Bbelb_100130 [Branchiostoma belcheri]